MAAKTSGPEEYLTKAQAARYLNVSSRTLERWLAKNYPLGLIRVGRLVRFRRAALERFFSRRTVR